MLGFGCTNMSVVAKAGSRWVCRSKRFSASMASCTSFGRRIGCIKSSNVSGKSGCRGTAVVRDPIGAQLGKPASADRSETSPSLLPSLATDDVRPDGDSLGCPIGPVAISASPCRESPDTPVEFGRTAFRWTTGNASGNEAALTASLPRVHCKFSVAGFAVEVGVFTERRNGSDAKTPTTKKTAIRGRIRKPKPGVGD